MTYDATDTMAIAAAYNEFPYESMPFSHSHPARLAAAAQLFGLKPPDIRTARVLELGCAAGGNLIPHAAYYPSATFVGIDLAGVQIAEGKQRIAQLGLTNIELREGSITDVGADDGKFDYIISHGLYCWVPDFVRDAVMRISAENLSPTGVAYISYNVYPGWHMKKIVRDLMLFHTLPLQNPRERVVAARKILADVHKYSSGAYHAIIAQEMENLESVGDYYIRHDQLAEENNPLLFTDFAAHAKQHGLEFIAEADLAGTFAESYMPALARAVRQASQNDMLKTQQYLDYFLGRTFRMSILVKEEYIAALDRRVTHEGLKTLAFAVKGPIHKDGPLLSADGMPAFESTFAAYSNGSDAMLVQTPASERAMDFLSSPLSMATGTLTVQTLAEYVFATDAPTESELREMSSLISELFRRRLVQLWSIPFHWAKVSEKPKAFAILRSDALHGHEYSTLIAHEPIHFAFPSTRVFLTLLDGTRDRAALQAELVKRVESGALKLESLNYDFEGIEAEDVAEACRIYVDITLNNFAKFRMLES